MKTLLLALTVLFTQASLANLVSNGIYTKIGTWSDLNGHGGIAVIQWTQNGAVGVNHGTLIDSNTKDGKYPNITFSYTYQFVSMDNLNRVYDVTLQNQDRSFSSVGVLKSNASSYITTISQIDPTSDRGGKMQVVEHGTFTTSSLTRMGSITLANGNIIFYHAADMERTELKR